MWVDGFSAMSALEVRLVVAAGEVCVGGGGDAGGGSGG